MNIANKATQLLKPVIDHLSLVFKTGADGREWAPRNEEAIVLGLKAAPSGTVKSLAPSFSEIGERIATMKGWYTDGPVVDGEENATGKAAQYNSLVALIYQMYYDLQSGTWINDDEARSAAVTIVIDNFLEQLDELRDGAGTEAGKAGARHSKSDKEHLEAIGAATKSINEHLTALGAGDATPTGDDPEPDDEDAEKARAVKALEAWTPGEVGENGLPSNYGELAELVGKAKSDKKDPKKPYGDVEYADEGLQEDGVYRYPIDTKAHAKSAWSYINKEENASKYSADDLAKVKAKIKAACEKFGVDIKAKAGAGTAPGITQDALDAAVAKAVADAIEKEKARVDTEITAAREETRKANERATAAEAALAATPTATAVTPTVATPTQKAGTTTDPESRLQRTIKAQLATHTEPMIMGRG